MGKHNILRMRSKAKTVTVKKGINPLEANGADLDSDVLYAKITGIPIHFAAEEHVLPTC